MGGFLKNVAVSVALVTVGTVVSVMTAFMVALWLTTPPQAASGADAVALAFGSLIAVGAAMLAGVYFCIFTLFMAAVTMPPTLWLARRLSLPRPALDIAGGASVAYLCVQIALEQTNSLEAYGLFKGDTPLIFAVVGVVSGGALGLLRHVVLNPTRPRAPLVFLP